MDHVTAVRNKVEAAQGNCLMEPARLRGRVDQAVLGTRDDGHGHRQPRVILAHRRSGRGQEGRRCGFGPICDGRTAISSGKSLNFAGTGAGPKILRSRSGQRGLLAMGAMV